MSSVSRSQQRLFGMVYACQKTGNCASPAIAKIANNISHKDAKDFAKTKHKGLPERKQMKKKGELKSFAEFMDLHGAKFNENLDAQNRGIAQLLQMGDQEEQQLKSQGNQLLGPLVRKLGILLKSTEENLGGNNNQAGENTDQWHQQAVKLLYVAFKMAAAGGKKQWNDSMLRKNIKNKMSQQQPPPQQPPQTNPTPLNNIS